MDKKSKQNQPKASFYPASLDMSNLIRAMKSFVAVEIETLPGNYTDGKILSLAAIRYEQGEETERFETCVNPKLISLLEKNLQNKGISEKILKFAPPEKKALAEFLSFMDKAANSQEIVVGHDFTKKMQMLIDTLNWLGLQAEFAIFDVREPLEEYFVRISDHSLSGMKRAFEIKDKYDQETLNRVYMIGVEMRVLIDMILNEDSFEFVLEGDNEVRKTWPEPREILISAAIIDLLDPTAPYHWWSDIYKDSSHVVCIRCLYPAIQFKCTKKGDYLLINREIAEDLGLKTDKATKTEGGDSHVRFYFTYGDLRRLKPMFEAMMQTAYLAMQKNMENSPGTEEDFIKEFRLLCRMTPGSASMIARNLDNLLESSDVISQVQIGERAQKEELPDLPDLPEIPDAPDAHSARSGLNPQKKAASEKNGRSLKRKNRIPRK